ncbi:putative major facilitator superfamily transporter [Gordonia rhizosphera NBRC 16068]|uniref:Putative major facilitator superfamily transporter n=1 Tax=Gordonia rhizosphera NBRC 16068 TaxID=1108045 RepID=K6VVD1_9ACTN|nr:MFS transporter [Gordonia rhizosphera]GAB90820.1 putative major facilitator superfamily transporter [Gordonia rhizosphera NBRC 16068]
MTSAPRVPLSAWRFVAVFGVVSLLADVVYEGARSITGPLLASLGATGLVVGVVTGVGEAAALGLRLVSGPLADRTRRFWAWTLAGYAITVISVPLLGIAGTLWVAGGLVITERIGKAVRSPAKDTLLSHATHVTGRGRGFAVHEALDQIGAVLGPLVVAVMLALTGDDYGPTLGILALPGVATLALLVWLRLRVPEPALYEPAAPDEPGPTHPTRRTIPGWHPSLPRRFWIYLGFTATTMIGFTTFGLLSFHMVEQNIVPTPAVPLIYTAAMAADAVAALATGWAYDRYGARTLAALPLLAALTPVLAFTDATLLVIAGTLLWGAAVGIQESTLRAVVADLVTPPRRATAYGIFAAGLGAATALGGVLTGWLYDVSIPALMVTVAVVQLVAVAVGVAIVRR